MYSTNFVVLQLGKIRIWKSVIIIRLKLGKKNDNKLETYSITIGRSNEILG
jgi:hypothetical protein